MKVKRPSVRGKQGYKYLGHFAQDKNIQAGHNWAWLASLGSAYGKLAALSGSKGGATGAGGLVSNLLGGSPQRSRQHTPDYLEAEKAARGKMTAGQEVTAGLGQMAGSKKQPADPVEFVRGVQGVSQGIKRLMQKDEEER